MELQFTQTDEYIKSNELLKQSTVLKPTDILKSIELIKEAIRIYPSDDSSIKLASYYAEAKQSHKSYAVLNGLLSKYSYLSFTDGKNMRRNNVYEKIAVIYYKDKRYKDYIKSVSLQFYNYIIGLAVQGRANEIIYLTNIDSVGQFFVATKINKSFKELNLSNKQVVFYSQLLSYFDKRKEKLFKLCDIYEKSTRSLNNIPDNESIGDYEDKILNKNKTFVDIYNSFDEKLVLELVDAQLNAH